MTWIESASSTKDVLTGAARGLKNDFRRLAYAASTVVECLGRDLATPAGQRAAKNDLRRLARVAGVAVRSLALDWNSPGGVRALKADLKRLAETI